MFKAFKPSGMEKIARAMGYQGNMQGFQDYLAQDPMRQQQMQQYQFKAMQMAKGGMVKMREGGALAAANTAAGYSPALTRVPMDMDEQATKEAAPFQQGQFVPGNLAQAQNQMQMSGNFTGNLADAYDPRGISNYIPPRGQEGSYGQAVNLQTGEISQPEYLTGTKDQYNAFLKEYRNRSGPRVETSDVRFLPVEGGNIRGSGTMFGAFQDYLRGQQSSQSQPAVNVGGLEAQRPFDLSSYTPEFIPDTSKVKPEDQLRREYEQARANAKAQRDAGFLGRIMLPGEMPYEDWKQGNQYELMRNPKFMPSDLDPNRPFTGQPPLPAGGTYDDNPMDPRYLRDGIPILPGMDDRGLGQPPQQPSQKVPQQYVPQQEFETVKKTQFKDPYGQAYDSKEEYEAAMLTAETRKFKTEDGQTIDVPFVSGRPTIQIPEGATATGDDPVKMYNEVYEIPQAEVGEIELAPTVGDITAQMLSKPGLPPGATTMAAQIQEQPGQMIDPTTGQVTGTVDVTAATAGTALATPAQEKEANLMQASTAAAGVDTALQATQAAQGTVDPKAEITAAQQTASSVGNVSAAQGNAILMDNPNQREIQNGELIDGVANVEKASKFTEEIQAAQATPSKQATVQGQLEGLMTQFEGGETPVWAAGAMRAATAAMAARGLGASSIAGQAVVQAAMESALPIAQADAAVQSQFEAQNLSNRQQRAMLAAEQRAKFMGMEFDQAFQSRVLNAGRIADVANRNFTAEQQVALENSRIANSMNLANLNNSQALIMAEAAALSQLDMANLNNRQQAAVQNAQNFMQMDMANLSNRQQTEMFKSQQRIQSLFNDQAAENAARQFNASSQNQVDQFFANLSTQTSQFNASQTNAQNQFNAGQLNAIEQFNAEINNQRDQFNAKNQLVIAQNNAQWRREIATANTAAVNRANEINASAVLEMSRDAYDNLWNYYSDTMEWAWTSAESQLDRYQEMALEQLRQDKALERTNIEQGTSAGNAIGNMIATLGSAIIPKLF